MGSMLSRFCNSLRGNKIKKKNNKKKTLFFFFFIEFVSENALLRKVFKFIFSDTECSSRLLEYPSLQLKNEEAIDSKILNQVNKKDKKKKKNRKKNRKE